MKVADWVAEPANLGCQLVENVRETTERARKGVRGNAHIGTHTTVPHRRKCIRSRRGVFVRSTPPRDSGHAPRIAVGAGISVFSADVSCNASILGDDAGRERSPQD